MTRWLVALLLITGCSKKSEAPAPPPDDRPKPTITEAEATRGRDACRAYVNRVCKCALDGADQTIRDRFAEYAKAHPGGSDDPATVVMHLVHEAKLPLSALSEPLQSCELSRALPDALRVAHEVSLSPDSSAKDIAQAEDMQRKTIKECFEGLAKLPPGCP